MGFLNNVVSFVKDILQANQQREDAQKSSEGWDILFEKVIELSKRYEEIDKVFATDWQYQSESVKEETARNLKRLVREILIPAAGGLSLLGVPGILVYTPCQIVGALAIAHIYRPDLTLTLESTKSVVGVMLWGKSGQVVWITVAEKFATLFPLPGLGLVVIPFVSAWTNIALNTVQKYYRNHPSPSEEHSEGSVISLTGLEKSNVESETLEKANELLQYIEKGGKVLFPAQEEVFRKLVYSQKTQSALSLGRPHIFRGVAGSGKTVILAQLVPHLISSFQANYNKEPTILIYHHNTYIRQLLRKEIQAAIKNPIDLKSLPDRVYTQRVHIHTLTTLITFLDNRNFFISKPISTKDRSETARKVRSSLKKFNGEFDIVLVDEGQDLDGEQFDLITDLCRTDQKTCQKSIYIFYDDLQNIFKNEGVVLSRFKDLKATEHFLSSCVRTSKKIMDFVFNTCLGSSLDSIHRNKLEQVMNIDELKKQELISIGNIDKKTTWIDCRFCVFPGEMPPQVQHFDSILDCFEAIQKELNAFLSEQDVRDKLQGGILIICFTNDSAKNLYKYLVKDFGEDVQLRSGNEIGNREKLHNLAVESARINIANIWDVKGYDADIVYIINPDEGGGSSYDHRVRFYVAATRAKQFLAVYNTVSTENSPIACDALKTVSKLQANFTS